MIDSLLQPMIDLYPILYSHLSVSSAVVTDADYSRGVHSAVLRSSGLPSGLYFYRLTTDAGVIQRKMLLMR